MSTVGSYYALRLGQKLLGAASRLFGLAKESRDSLSIEMRDNFSSWCEISDILKYWPPERTRDPDDYPPEYILKCRFSYSGLGALRCSVLLRPFKGLCSAKSLFVFAVNWFILFDGVRNQSTGCLLSKNYQLTLSTFSSRGILRLLYPYCLLGRPTSSRVYGCIWSNISDNVFPCMF